MKWIARVFVFTVMFLGGIAAASSLPSTSGLANCVVRLPRTVLQEPIAAPRPKGVIVMYAGWMEDAITGEPMLRFVIYNGSGQPITYSAKSPESPFPEIAANRRKMRGLVGCGNGIQTFAISPGSSAEVHVYLHQFLERPRKSDDVTVGFYLRTGLDKDSQVYTSQPFLLPDKLGSRSQRFANDPTPFL